MRGYNYNRTIVPLGTRGWTSLAGTRKRDFFVDALTTFSCKQRREMKTMHDYQKRLDERLAKPKSKPIMRHRYIL